ncbi:MAG TPA: hypothetical protein VK737_12080, partial [Opitutales bacterium]|nr:hypothetical protein [Opitutales bacterium]
VPEAQPYVAPHGWSAKMEQIRIHSFTQRVAPKVPGLMKRMAKGLLVAVPAPTEADVFASLNSKPPGPTALSKEMTLLQRCVWRFPIEGAASQLGWTPLVDWPMAVERTLGWLQFADALPKVN